MTLPRTGTFWCRFFHLWTRATPRCSGTVALMTRLQRTAKALALLPVLVLTGCGSQSYDRTSPTPAAESSLNAASPLCLQLANSPGRVGEDSFPTDSGRIRLVAGAIELRDGDDVALIAEGADRLIDVRELDGVTHVFFSRNVDEYSDLMVVTADSAPRRIGVADAPEYTVTSVSRHAGSGNWILTAISDLTEVIVELDGKGEQVRVVEPYEYNRSPFLLMAEPLPSGGFFLLEGPEGDSNEWSVATVDDQGGLRTRLPIPTTYGLPTGWFDRARSGEFVLGTDGASLVVTHEDGNVTFTECSTTPRDRLIRR
jgi:hypothetical protein